MTSACIHIIIIHTTLFALHFSAFRRKTKDKERVVSPHGSLKIPDVIEIDLTHTAHGGVSSVDKQVTGVREHARPDGRTGFKLAQRGARLAVPQPRGVVGRAREDATCVAW